MVRTPAVQAQTRTRPLSTWNLHTVDLSGFDLKISGLLLDGLSIVPFSTPSGGLDGGSGWS